MTSSLDFAVPKKERLEVQLIDGTEEHNVKYVITSLATIKGDDIFKISGYIPSEIMGG